MLKRLAIHAVRAFKKEVKAGERENLTEDELREKDEGFLEEILQKGLEEAAGVPSARPGKDAKKAKGRDTGVKQTKIVRVTDRIDVISGKGRSKGYGFIEMTTHGDALRVLRWSNNNPTVGILFEEWYKEELGELLKKEKKEEQPDEARITRIKGELESGTWKGKKEGKGTLIVEFSIENVQVVQRRAAAAAAGPKKKREEEHEVRILIVQSSNYSDSHSFSAWSREPQKGQEGFFF